MALNARLLALQLGLLLFEHGTIDFDFRLAQAQLVFRDVFLFAQAPCVLVAALRIGEFGTGLPD
jgi:hypothetical protein